jgi:hypothetical protein
MGELVGSSAPVSTWGKFRCAWCFQENFDYITSPDTFNIQYISGQKAIAAGSGLIRWNRGEQSTINQQPSLSNFFGGAGNRLFLVPSFSPLGNQAASEEFEADMVGQTVTMVSGSGTIDSTLFDTGIQVLGGATPYGDITDVGLLEAF